MPQHPLSPFRLAVSALVVALWGTMGSAPWIPRSAMAETQTAAAKPTVAVVDFRAIGVPVEFGEAVAENFRNSLAHLKRYVVVERSQIQQALKEQTFSQTGMVDAKQAVTLGKLIGARIIVVGSVTKIGSTYTLNTRFIDVVTGETREAESLKTRDEDQLAGLVDQLAVTLSDAAQGPPAAGTPPPPAAQPQVPAEYQPSGPVDLIAKHSHLLPSIQGTISSVERVVSGQYVKTFRSAGVPIGHDAAVYVMNSGEMLYVGIDSRWPVAEAGRCQVIIDGNADQRPDGQTGPVPTDFFVGLAAFGTMAPNNQYGVRQGEMALCATPGCTDDPPHGFLRSSGQKDGQAVYEFLVPLAAMGVHRGQTIRLGLVLAGSAADEQTGYYPLKQAFTSTASYYRDAMTTLFLQ